MKDDFLPDLEGRVVGRCRKSFRGDIKYEGVLAEINHNVSGANINEFSKRFLDGVTR